MQPRVIAIAAAAAVIVIAGAGYWWWSSRTAPTVSTAATAMHPAAPAAAAEAPAVETPPEPSIRLPALNDSDAFIREQVGALSERLNDWLGQDELVRRFAVVIDNGAIGEIPRRQLAFLAPSGRYPVLERDGRTFVDPAGYARYDGFVDTVLSVPPEQAAALLKTLAPLLRQALGELGPREPDPLSAVRAAVRQALQTPELHGDVELTQPKVLYRYEDQSVESLLPLQKQLLRMGPDNVARLKSYLREVQKFL
jgi:Protein of unknown function (DUF3014)